MLNPKPKARRAKSQDGFVCVCVPGWFCVCVCVLEADVEIVENLPLKIE